MIGIEILLENDRFDRRRFDEPRKYQIDNIDGSYILSHERTILMLSYQKAYTIPYVDKPHEGIITFSVINNGKRNDKLNNFLYRIFVNQRCIDLESFCIEYNKKVIHYSVELRIISLDGLAYEPLIELVNHFISDATIPHNFIPQCFYFIKLSKFILRDPIELEELEKDWSFLCVMRSQQEYIFTEKSGNPCSEDEVFDIVYSASRSFIA